MKVEITIPESLSEITLGQYQKYLKIEEQNDDVKFLQSKMIEIFCDVPLEYVMKMKIKDVRSITDTLIDLINRQSELVLKFNLNNKEFGFIPNLEDISLGEYIDLDTYISEWDNMHLAMNVLYRPIETKFKDRYSIVEYKANDGLHMKDMPMDAVIGSVLFFYRLGKELSQNILKSFQKQQENNLAQSPNSQPSGDGINQSMHSLTEILRDLKISLN